VVFESSQDAEAAKNELDCSKFDGNTISVEFSKRCRPREPTPGKYLGSKKNKVDPNPETRDDYRPRVKRSRSRENLRDERSFSKRSRRDSCERYPARSDRHRERSEYDRRQRPDDRRRSPKRDESMQISKQDSSHVSGHVSKDSSGIPRVFRL